jgi:hypothetical protein
MRIEECVDRIAILNYFGVVRKVWRTRAFEAFLLWNDPLGSEKSGEGSDNILLLWGQRMDLELIY